MFLYVYIINKRPVGIQFYLDCLCHCREGTSFLSLPEFIKWLQVICFLLLHNSASWILRLDWFLDFNSDKNKFYGFNIMFEIKSLNSWQLRTCIRPMVMDVRTFKFALDLFMHHIETINWLFYLQFYLIYIYVFEKTWIMNLSFLAGWKNCPDLYSDCFFSHENLLVFVNTIQNTKLWISHLFTGCSYIINTYL